MAKRVYWQTVKKWALITGVPAGILSFALLFMYLSALGVIEITGHSGDSICEGTLEDPCIALINFTAKEDIFIYPFDYDPWERNTPFYTDEELKDWKMYRSWGTGWREIKLNQTCQQKWCGAPYNNMVDNKYAFAFREGRNYQIKIVAYKNSPYEDIKWGFTDELDPIWIGIIDIKNRTYINDLRTTDRIITEGELTKTYNSSEKEILIEDKDDTIIKMRLTSPYVVSGLIASNDTKVAEFYLEDWKDGKINMIDTIKFYDVRNDYAPINKNYRFKWENVTEECPDIPKQNESRCYNYTEWVPFESLNELPQKNIKISMWASTERLEKIEWIPTIEGFEILQWAQWDISTAVWLQDFDVSGEEAVPRDSFFKPDGTKMYVIGTAGDSVDEYDLSIAWNISTASALQLFSVGGQETSPRGLFFKPDGTKMYVVGTTGDDINEYNLSVAWDVTSAVWSQAESVSSENTAPVEVFFKSDGTKMYMAGQAAGDYDVNEYDLSIAWDVSTLSYVGRYDVAAEAVGLNGLWFKPDGSKMYTANDAIKDIVIEYDLSTPFDISTVSFVQNLSITDKVAGVGGVDFNSIGSKMYVVDVDSADINEYDLPIIDMTPPGVTINQPLNQSYDTKVTYFNVTALDETAMKDCNYTLNSGFTNFTMTNASTSPTYWNATNSTMNEGGQKVIYHCWDTVGNLNNSEDRSFNINFNPEMTFDYPENKSYNEVTKLNYTYIETSPGYCQWSNDSGVTKSDPVTMGTNWTGLSSMEKNNTWTLYCNDTFGNSNSTNMTFTIDTINPWVGITFPINNTNWSKVTLNVNFTRSDINLADCWYSNDTYLKNITLADCGNLTDVIWSDAKHNVTVWVNDTAGNENSSRISFRIDTTNPEINITSPINNTNHTDINLNINFTRSDATLESCWYSNDTYKVNISLANCGNITDVVWLYSQHNVTIWANDSAGNENSSKITFTIYAFEENIPLRELELGSNVNITANTNLEVVCVDIDSPPYGINYSCSSDVNIAFNISYFRKITISNGSLSITKNYTNPTYFNVSFINISAHQYDEVNNLSLNISGLGKPRDVTFYKVNTTNFDRVYQGHLIGSEIYLNKSCDSGGAGTCVGFYNLTFPNPGSQAIYFYLDDNIGIFNFTLNVSGGLYGFEFEDTFENDTFIDHALTTAQLDLSGTIMPPNSSYKEFVYDDFEDGDINSGLWVKTSDYSAADAGWSYSGAIQEDGGYIQLKIDYEDPGDELPNNEKTLQLAPNLIPLNMYATDDIKFNLSNRYSSSEGNPFPTCHGDLDIYAGNTLIWTSMHVSSAIDNTEYSLAKRMKFHLTKINSTTWKCNITGEEYSKGYKPDIYERWNNWTDGTWNVDDDGDLSDGTLNNTFYFGVDYTSSYHVLFDNTVRDSGEGCNVISQITKIYYFNNSKWKRTNGTAISSSVFDSSGNIVDATFSGWGYNNPAETMTPYLSADGGVTWEAVTWYAKHDFSTPGKHIKWRVDFSNVSVDYVNKTTYLTNIKINTTQSNPSNITLDFGDDRITNVTIGGILNSTNGSITLDLSDHNLADSFTSRRSLYDHLYIIPLVVYSDSPGYVNLNSFNLTYNPNPVILNTTSIQSFLDNSVGLLNLSIPFGTYAGNITIDDIRLDYAGGNDTINVTIHSPDYTTYLNQTNITFWYSRWDYNFVPRFIEYLEFIPLTPTSKNVTPYGQSSNKTIGAIFNLTNYGYGGRNANLSIYLNDTLSCVNLTMSINHNKSDGFLINDSWFNIKKLSYLDTINLWMWADYECSYSAWHTFNPFIYFRQCAENCTCSEAI